MIDISGKLSPQLVDVYQHVSVAAEALEVRYVVVGAAARDLVLHYGYDAPVERATTDVDFGIRVATAEKYEMCRNDFATSQFERVSRLLAAFRGGFVEGRPGAVGQFESRSPRRSSTLIGSERTPAAIAGVIRLSRLVRSVK